MCGIKIGEYIEWYNNPEMHFLVVDDKHIEYKGENYTLTALAKEFLGKETSEGVRGPHYFKYKGQKLNELRRREENQEE